MDQIAIESVLKISVVEGLVYVVDQSRRMTILAHSDGEFEVIQTVTRGVSRGALLATPHWVASGTNAISIHLPQCQTELTPVSEGPTPAAAMLRPPAPNPFNPRIELRFQVPTSATASLDIFDVRGRLVRRLFRGRVEAGNSSIIWHGNDDRGRSVPAGQYLALLTTAGRRETQKITLVR
ncbi:MAG: T9SS type A sorting domain-containing protein [Phycisphaeraceae bacterium]|nr:T9SS type A sorting domain-containing protein [Phycisphaeraceae bacterium]